MSQDKKDTTPQTTSWGSTIDSDENSMTASEFGPVVMQDTHLIEKLAHFNRERIPERVVHAKGAGAHGYFEVTDEVKQFTKAKFLDTVGKRTPVFARFSTVAGEKGAADTQIDPRGFALKFYTEDGNYDLVGNNTPVFFIRDPIQFPDLIHSQKRNPQTNLREANTYWDFLSQVPESVHQVTYQFGERGIPQSFKNMNGYGSHTFKWVNVSDKQFWIKYHFVAEDGCKGFTKEEADKLMAQNPDHNTQDLFERIQKGETIAWKLSVQIMEMDDAFKYKWNVFDVTKVWPHADYPLHTVGRLVLNKNPDNYFQETEQVTFSPGNLVPGIEPSQDKMLQARLFAYGDAHRYRVGANHNQIPINCPYRARVSNTQRDGAMCVNGNQGNKTNYNPNSMHKYTTSDDIKLSHFRISGLVGRFRAGHPNSDFSQAGNLYRSILNVQQREYLINNIVDHIKGASREIQERQQKIFFKADAEFGQKFAQKLGFPERKSHL